MEQLIQEHLYHKSIDDETPVQVGQSAIKNAVYNLLTDKVDFTDYKIEVSYPHVYYAILDYCLVDSNLKTSLLIHKHWKKLPISIQCNDGKTNMMWDKCWQN